MNRAQTKTIVVRDERGGREFRSADLPLSIGGAPSYELLLPGADPGAAIAAIGMLDGRVFIQPNQFNGTLSLNRQPLQETRWLDPGDRIEAAGSLIVYSEDDTRAVLAVSTESAAVDTLPPELDSIAEQVAQPLRDEIKPIQFKALRAAQEQDKPARKRPGLIAVWALLGILAVLGWFSFTAKSVQLRFEPLPDEVGLSGTLFKLRIGDRYLLRAVEHRVVASKAGYYPFSQSFTVGGEDNQTFEYKLEKLPGRLSLTAGDVAGALVSLDGEPLGQTPLVSVEVKPGHYDLTIDAERYLPFQDEIEIEGRGTEQSLDLALTPAWAVISINARPAEASVWVDGERSAELPGPVEILAGERKVEVRRDGYKPWTITLTVEANTPQTLDDVELEPADGWLVVNSTPDGASVTINGQFRGRTPVGLSLPPGRDHRVAISKVGYASATRSIALGSGTRREISPELQPQYGDVEVLSQPEGAEIVIAGRVAGITPVTLSLIAAPAELELRKSGYQSRQASITPRPGFPQKLELNLLTLAEARVAAIPKVITTPQGPTLRLIYGGEFTMGTSRREQGRRSNETLRPVRIKRPYYLSTHEITNAQFRLFVADHNSGVFAGKSIDEDDMPVTRIGWEQAVAYCNWLSAHASLPLAYVKEGERWVAVQPLAAGYRLPTEAEWAWAARFQASGTPLKYPWGSELKPTEASGNFADRSAADILSNTLATYADGHGVAAPVGKFNANALELFDLGGNVSEWIHDYYAIYPSGATEPAIDPGGPASGRYRVIRGSSWKHATNGELRLSYRDYSDTPREDLGFRIARSLE